MPVPAVVRSLCCLVFGHEPAIEVNEAENKSEYVCASCRGVLGDFVTNLRRPVDQAGPRDASRGRVWESRETAGRPRRPGPGSRRDADLPASIHARASAAGSGSAEW
jgi:hypothetical protein